MAAGIDRYIQLAATANLRAKVLSGDAAVVFSRNMEEIVWANSQGARLFGGGRIAALLASPISRSHPFIRQLQDAALQIEGTEPVVRGFRIARGLTSQLIQCELQPLQLPEIGEAILLGCAPMDGPSLMREHERARGAVDALGDMVFAAAIVDGHGLPLAASPSFVETGLDEETIDKWLSSAGEQPGAESTAGSAVSGAAGDRSLQVYRARLNEKPARFLLAIDEAEAAEPEHPAPASVTAPAPASDERIGLGAAAAGALAAGAAASAASAGEADEQADTEESARESLHEDAAQAPDSVDKLATTAETPGEPVRSDDDAQRDLDGERESDPADQAAVETAQQAEEPPQERRVVGGMHQEVAGDDDDAVQPGFEAADSDSVETEAGEGVDDDSQIDSATDVQAADAAESADGKDAGAAEEGDRPQPIRSLLERWFMRRGDEEGPDEATGSPTQSQDKEHSTDEPVDEDDDGERETGNGLATAGIAAAAGAGIVAATRKSEPDQSADDAGADSPAEAASGHGQEDTEPTPALSTDAVATSRDDRDVETDGSIAEETSRAVAEATDGAEALPVMADETGAFEFSGAEDPIRFAWTTDENQVFVSVSPELAETLGPNAADIVGRRWSDVASVFGFDESGEIARLLESRDTWSGKSVLWPIQGADLVAPVDLAALPAFGSARNFEGFRGFGIIRTADAVVDPEETGLALVAGVPSRGPALSEEAAQLDDDRVERRPLSGQDSQPEEAGEQEGNAAGLGLAAGLASNVVDITSRTRGSEATGPHADEELAPNDEEARPLSGREAQAFEEIGRRLGRDAGQSGPETEGSAVGETGPQTTILEQLPLPVVVYRNGTTLFANRELLTVTGYDSAAEIDAAGGVEALFTEDSVSEGSNSAMKLRRGDGGEMEVSPLLKSVPWAGTRALLLTFRPSDRPDADVKAAIDITRVSELQHILDTATDGILVIDKHGTIESINQPAEALFGVEFDAVAGNHVTSLFAHESHRSIRDYMSELDGPGVASVMNDGREVIGKEAAGGLIPLFITLGRMGEAGKFCAVLRDLTQWKKAEEELVGARRAAETASEHKSDFLARVSHEIRTPLNAIIGFSDVMIEERFGAIDNERYREYLRDINRSGVHILDLINDLLDISKIEAGKMELSFEAVDLNQIVAETVALLQPQANVERIIIRTSLSRAVPRVVADARTIRQIILNLVSNAIKFTSANGQVIVSTVYETNGEVVLKVRDTGRGMSEVELEQALKPFSQIGVVEERRGQGTGLGLPLTKALVEANRAHFDLESVPGEGTIAHVQFPTQRVLAD